MGYRSDWKLVFNTAGKADEVMRWLIQEASSGSNYASMVEEMIKIAVVHQDDDIIEFADSSWKLWGWNDFMCAIENKWGTDDEVDFAWATIGENADDVETCPGEWTYVYIERYISYTDLSPVPKLERKGSMETEAKPRPPLKCTCGGFGAHKNYCDLETGEYTDEVY